MKILIVDDEEGIRNSLKKFLHRERMEVDLAGDGEEGSYLARTNRYDLIILDYGLPKKDGLTVCAEIRKDNIKTPILFLSVQAEPYTKAQLLNAGADDYLSKPFSFEEMIARIRALLRRPPVIQDAILISGLVNLDLSAHIVRVNEREVPLTTKEYMLLECLMRHKGSVVSRGAILENVWGREADPFSNTIEVHVSNLRKKLGVLGEKLIQTVSGCGYKILEV